MTSIIRAGTEDKEGFIYVPSMNLYVAKEKSYFGKSWYGAHEALAAEDSRMLTIPEFVNFLNHVKENNKRIYNDITQVRNPRRAEWLDAYFRKRKDGLYVLTGNKTKAEKLEKCLIKDRTPGISLDSWLKNPTSQGLPKPNVAKGDLCYFHPINHRFTWFGADSDDIGLGCDWSSSGGNPDLGVRVVKQRE